MYWVGILTVKYKYFNEEFTAATVSEDMSTKSKNPQN